MAPLNFYLGRMKSSQVIAVIVVFQPELETLHQLVLAAAEQVADIVIVSNSPEIPLNDFLPIANANIHLITLKSNMGIAYAQNIGIEWAATQNIHFILLLDQDDIWFPDKLKRAIFCLSILNSQGYSNNATAFWEGSKRTEVIKSQKQTSRDFLFEAAGPGCAYVFTQNTALQIQLMIQENKPLVNSVYMHDWLIYAFVRFKNYHWFIDENSFILYEQHKNNEVGANIGINSFIKRSRKVLSGWALGQSLQIARILDLGSTPFARVWRMGSRTAYLRLARYSRQCRRRLIDKVYFSLPV